MHKYLRENSKQIMAIVSIGLMVAWALPSGYKSISGEGAFGQITVGGAKTRLFLADQERARAEWQLLKGLAQHPSGAFQGVLESVFTPIGLRDMEAHEEMFLLLVKEAQANGAHVPPQMLDDQMMQLSAAVSLDPNSNEYTRYRNALNDLMLIQDLLRRASSVVKVSEPMSTYIKGMQRQTIQANLVEFAAADYKDKVEQPTEDQLKAQFEKFKSVKPEDTADGVGYRLPNRVKYENLSIVRAEVRKAVPVPFADDVDVREYYHRNKAEFTITTVPTTQETFTLDPIGRPQPASTRPISVTRPFDDVKAQIVTKLVDQRTELLMEQIRDFVRTTMRTDYEAHLKAGKAGAATRPASSLGVAYDSFDYLRTLALKVQEQFKVLPTIEQHDQWATQASLTPTALGKSTWEKLTLSEYLASRVDKFVPAEQSRALMLRQGQMIAAYEPSPLFAGEDNGAWHFLRVTAADAAREATGLAEVREQVRTDMVNARAYEKAESDAAEALKQIRAGQSLQTQANKYNKKMLSTGPITQLHMRFGMEIPSYKLPPESNRKLIEGLFELLQQPSPANPDHPAAVIDLPRVPAAILAEMDTVTPQWTQDRAALMTAMTATQLQGEMAMMFAAEWFSYDNVVKRTNYESNDRGARQQKETERPTTPKPEIPRDKPF